MGNSNWSTRRGFSHFDLITLIVVSLVVALGFAIGCPALHRARHGTDSLTCSTRLNQIHKGQILWANDHDGSYPLPTKVSPETAARGAQPGNSTANLHSLMIYKGYYEPYQLICPAEPNRNVVEFRDYKFGDRPDGTFQSGDAWDVRFSADLGKRKGCNVSYANMALLGGRLDTQWRDSLSADFAVFSDRGPKNGQPDRNSLTYRLHGARTSWTGNVAYNDGHVGWTSFSGADAQPFGVNGDNLFFADDGEMGGDMWLGLFGETTEEATTPYWD